MRKIALILPISIISSFLMLDQNAGEISPEKAYQMLKNPSTYLVDVRSIAEYVFIGHPKEAYNIPLMFWSEEKQDLVPNANFIQDIKSRFKENDTLIFICRSGKRSLVAAELAKAENFTNVYNLKEGFEGEKDERGYRTLNGWRKRGLPYTYDLLEEFIYRYLNQKSAKTEQYPLIHI